MFVSLGVSVKGMDVDSGGAQHDNKQRVWCLGRGCRCSVILFLGVETDVYTQVVLVEACYSPQPEHLSSVCRDPCPTPLLTALRSLFDVSLDCLVLPRSRIPSLMLSRRSTPWWLRPACP